MLQNPYDPQVIKRLFDEMAGTYGWVNIISSFGFCWRWRKQCVRAIQIPTGGNAVDLMTGMGELCPDISRVLGPHGNVIALDISESMCRQAEKGTFACPVRVIQTDVLNHRFAPASADTVVCSFGLKTFSTEQIQRLAQIVAGVLKPGGVFSFVEISVPNSPWLRWPYMFYLNRVVPLIGMIFLGNPDNYRQLGIYTRAFQNCVQASRVFAAAGLDVQFRSYFFGCATGVSGSKPGLP